VKAKYPLTKRDRLRAFLYELVFMYRKRTSTSVGLSSAVRTAHPYAEP